MNIQTEILKALGEPNIIKKMNAWPMHCEKKST